MTNTTTQLFYIDDDQDDLEFFKDATDELGESVALFSLPEELIKKLHNPPPSPSVIFMDLNMPVKTGYDILQHIRDSAAFKDLPLVIYSTSNNTSTFKKCRDMGASLYITKPTSIGALKKAIQYVIDIDWENFEATEHNFIYRG